MRFKQYIQEEITTATVDNLDADSVTSNKLLRVQLKDDKIKSLINKLKEKGVDIDVKDNIATIDIPYHVDKSIMKQLSKYTI